MFRADKIFSLSNPDIEEFNDFFIVNSSVTRNFRVLNSNTRDLVCFDRKPSQIQVNEF